MKNTFLFTIITFLMFTSCKKENAASPVNGNTDTGIKTTDAAAVSGSLTVWHSSKITGGFPAAGNNANAPVLYHDPYNNTFKTVAGKICCDAAEYRIG